MRSHNASPTSNGSRFMPPKDSIPGCTDYSPKHETVKRKLPRFAPTREKRFRMTVRRLAEAGERPHSYESPDSRNFMRSNSGSFGRATRFDPPGTNQLKNTIRTMKRFWRKGNATTEKHTLTVNTPAMITRPVTQQQAEVLTPKSIDSRNHRRITPSLTVKVNRTANQSFRCDDSPENRPGPATYDTRVHSCI